MKNNNKWLLGGLIGFTVILLATAVWLFIQLNQASPTASPKPKAIASMEPETPGIEEVTAIEVCAIGFTVTASASPSTSPSTSPSASPSTSPEPIACFDQCASKDDCEDSRLDCLTVGGEKRCVNPSCPEDTNCVCPEDAKVCYDKCENSNDCPENLSCETIPGTNDRRCVNSNCNLESDCKCPASASPSTITYNPPASTTTVTKGGQPVLPQAGLPGPAVLGISTGLLLILGALLF